MASQIPKVTANKFAVHHNLQATPLPFYFAQVNNTINSNRTDREASCSSLVVSIEMIFCVFSRLLCLAVVYPNQLLKESERMRMRNIYWCDPAKLRPE